MMDEILKMRKEWAENDAKRDAGLVPPEGLTRHLDIPYGPDPENKLDVYYPKGTNRPLPCILSIHGGGWFYGDKELYSHYCMKLSQRGFAVVNFTYRLAPEHKYPAALEDCCRSLHWVAENAETYHIDRGNLFTVGDSAGGQLSYQLLTMVSNPAYTALFPFDCPKNITIRACGMNCGCYFMPFSRLLPPKRMGVIFEAYFPEDYLAAARQMKAKKYITNRFPPAFVMSAQNDYLKFMAPMLHRLLRRRGVESVLKIYGTKQQKDIGHVFHLNCRSDLADLCNDDQCAFFRSHMG